MVTSEIDIIKKRSKDLPKEQKLELIGFLTRELSRVPHRSKPIKFGKYASSSRRMSTADDFNIAEWHPADLDLNGN